MEVIRMAFEKATGLITIIVGLLLMIFPMFSSEMISVIVGLSLIFLGLSITITGLRSDSSNSKNIMLVTGILAIIFGLLFIFFIDSLSFLVGLQFYIVGFIMIVFGLTGLFSKMSRVPAFSSILILVMGIVLIALGTFSLNQPIFIAIIIGVVLIIEGVLELMSA